MIDEAERHRPVMVEKVLEFLLPATGLADRREDIFLDATVGYGGHAEALLEAGGPNLRLLGIDRDAEALAFSRNRLSHFGDRVTLAKENFSHLGAALDHLSVECIGGALFDLGMSSPQVDEANRGFGWTHPGPLDMRMDRDQETTAATLVNQLPAAELQRILKTFGEERFAKQIARHMVAARDRRPIQTTAELAEIVASSIPARFRSRHRHPATRTFQALRIAVNNELDVIPAALEAASERLVPGGRIVVLSYHSLEDRLAKQTFRKLATGLEETTRSPFDQPKGRRILQILTKRPLRPGEAEVYGNPRARSAHLRAAERRENG
jgi:16S rRNA (cytosine1402-N4)-methyltransferase